MIAERDSRLWFACVDGRFAFKEWPDDDAVVYDKLSGDTHVVDVLAMEVRHLLLEVPGLGIDDLVADLRELFENEPDTAIAERVERGLSRLQEIGLVACQHR